MANSEYSVTHRRIVQLARDVWGNSLHLGNHFGNVCNSLKYVCNSQKTVYVCPNRCFLCVTRVDVASTIHDLVGTGLSGYHADTPITIKAEPFIWPTAAFINIHEHPI